MEYGCNVQIELIFFCSDLDTEGTSNHSGVLTTIIRILSQFYNASAVILSHSLDAEVGGVDGSLVLKNVVPFDHRSQQEKN